LNDVLVRISSNQALIGIRPRYPRVGPISHVCTSAESERLRRTKEMAAVTLFLFTATPRRSPLHRSRKLISEASMTHTTCDLHHNLVVCWLVPLSDIYMYFCV
jgi:hypothetical protein